jgi:arginyl-tRNA synthetase
MKHVLEQTIETIVVEWGVVDYKPVVTRSAETSYGDYTTTAPLQLAKRLHKKPAVVAEDLKTELEKRRQRTHLPQPDHFTEQSGQKASPDRALGWTLADIEKIEIAGPGFVNFTLTASALSKQMIQVLKEKNTFGTVQNKKNEAIVLIEFAQANPFKEFHIGHLRNIVLGEAYSRLHEALGEGVKRVNYQGDVGMHVAKALYGLGKIQNSKPEIRNWEVVETWDVDRKAKLLGEAYAVGAQAFEEDETAKNEIIELNKKVYGRDPSVIKLWEEGRAWSLAYFEMIYERVGTQFERLYFESETAPLGKTLVESHLKDGVFEASEGAIVYRGEKVGLHTRVFVTKEGYATYEAKDLALAPLKYQEFKYDLSIIMTGNEQGPYFEVMLAALKEINPEIAAKTTHVTFGMVNLKEGKMSSRSGNVITGVWLIEQAKQKIFDILDKAPSKAGNDQVSGYTQEQKEEIAEKAALAAVKYSMLRVGASQDIAFDLQASVNFDGDSGPYVQYTYARIKSVLRKSGLSDNDILSDIDPENVSLNSTERSLLQLFLYYPQLVQEAATGHTPNTIATYLFQLAQAFNAFYATESILGKDVSQTTRSVRLAISASTAQIIHNGLYLLGIETLEYM